MGATFSANISFRELNMRNSVIIINGPNLNMLGNREPEIYGNESLADIEMRCLTHAKDLGLEVNFRQSNTEGEIVGWIQESSTAFGIIIINAGAYTHTSIAIHDALKCCGLPVLEVHLSNIFQRESFRHFSYISTLANGVICGLGSQGYELALQAAAKLLRTK